MNEHYFEIASHSLVLTADSSVSISALLPSFQPFALPNGKGKPLFTLSLTEKLLPAINTAELTRFEWEGAECIINTHANGYEIIVYPDSSTSAKRMQTNKDFTHAIAEAPFGDNRDTFVVNNFLMMLYAFATAPHYTLMFHASVIRNNNNGYLFLGKSGTGKSTHSRLWLNNIEGSELLNDDNPIVRYYLDGRVIVYGSPWSGKTPCYRNEEVPVRAFVRLQQAPYNKITREGTAHAFASLIPSCSCLKHDPAQYDSICDTVAKIAATAPIYHLECLPDIDAAQLCFSTISNSKG